MSEISNDTEFQQALGKLDLGRQRQVAARFIENVLTLSDDPRVGRAAQAAGDANASPDDLNNAYRAAKGAALEAHARCGADGEWSDQTGYFVARAAEAAVAPQVRSEGKGPAWKAAMSCRMARTCLAADTDEDAHDKESHTQYRILAAYLNQ